MCVSETKMNSGVIDTEINIPGYILLRLDRKNLRNSTVGEGGVAKYLKNNIHFLALSIPSNKEVLWMKVNLPNKSYSL